MGAKADLSRRDKQGMTPFLECINGGHSSIMKLLLNFTRGLSLHDADDAGRLPLHCAAVAGHREITELLLRVKADFNALNADGLTAMQMAENAGHSNISELLRTAMEPKRKKDGDQEKKKDSQDSPQEFP